MNLSSLEGIGTDRNGYQEFKDQFHAVEAAKRGGDIFALFMQCTDIPCIFLQLIVLHSVCS